jgi:cytochrome c oxidase subunit 2
VDVFNNLFTAFLLLGTIVGTVVISYTLYNAYKYRVSESEAHGEYDIEESATDGGKEDVARPSIGEIPTGTGKGGGKKLFLSFSLSAILVLGLVIFAYANLLYVEGTPANENATEIGVEANQYQYTYTYPSGMTVEGGPLVVPENKVVELNVTSCHPSECPQEDGSGNVWHTWTSPDLKASSDAIPGQYTQTWFQADDPGTYLVQCRELCGQGHSGMRFEEGVEVKTTEEFRQWCTDNNCMSDEKLNSWLDDSGGDSA